MRMELLKHHYERRKIIYHQLVVARGFTPEEAARYVASEMRRKGEEGNPLFVKYRLTEEENFENFVEMEKTVYGTIARGGKIKVIEDSRSFSDWRRGDGYCKVCGATPEECERKTPRKFYESIW